MYRFIWEIKRGTEDRSVSTVLLYWLGATISTHCKNDIERKIIHIRWNISKYINKNIITHTHTHTHTHTYTHTHTQTVYINTHTHTHTHSTKYCHLHEFYAFKMNKLTFKKQFFRNGKLSGSSSTSLMLTSLKTTSATEESFRGRISRHHLHNT